MKKVIVRYIDEAWATNVVMIGPADEMIAKRELAGKEWADKEYVLYYQTFLASRRSGLVQDGVKFDPWLETIAEVEPRISLQEIEDAEAMGEIKSAQADFLRKRVSALGDDVGESQAPRS